MNVRNWPLSQVQFTDNTALVADSGDKFSRLLSDVSIMCEQKELRVIWVKSTLLRLLERGGVSGTSVIVNGMMLEAVECFCYPGLPVARGRCAVTWVSY